MVSDIRVTIPQQKRWLREFAEGVIESLREKGMSRSTRLVVPQLFDSHARFKGWYIRLGSFKNRQGGPYLFLDSILQLEYRSLWYGVWSPTGVQHSAVLRRTRSIWGLVEDWDLDDRVEKQRLESPFTERRRGGEFYFGMYEWRRPNFIAKPSQAWISRVSDFLVSIDELWPVTLQEKQSIRVPSTISLRRGQASFRSDMLAAYSRKCCISNSRARPVLEAAHIELNRGRDDHSTSNGLLLRSDIHTLFDLAIIAIRPSDLSVHLHPDLRESEYARYEGRIIGLPSGTDKRALSRRLQHRWTRFKKAKRKRID